jgi:hypothetical protein
MNDFNPEPGALYARCSDCGKALADEASVRTHSEETMKPTGEAGVTARSHRVRILNPSREQRISGEVDRIVGDATQAACDDLWRLVDDGDLTEDEVAVALRWHDDFSEAWEEDA